MTAATDRAIPNTAAASEIDVEAIEPTSWSAVDLREALSGVDVEPPSVLQRTDGLCLLYPSRVHAFQGESESLKSWAAQFATKQTIAAGGDVLYIDFEDDAAGVVARLLALGLASAEIAAHLVYIRPDEPLRTRYDEATRAAADLAQAFAARSFALCIIDGVTEAMTTEGLDLLSNADIATWMRRLPRRIAKTGAAVVVIDHLPKDRMNQGRYAIGGQHKLAGLTGAAYKFVVTRYFSRAAGTTPVEGRVLITVEKDRPGYVRGRAIEDKIAELHLTSYPDGGVSASLEPPMEGGEVDDRVARRIVDFLSVYDGSSKNKIELGVEGNAKAIRSALSWMADPMHGWVRVEPKGLSHLHWLTPIGRSEAGTRDES
jgi:hypothetical protein